jgi:hypothetical protein
LSSFKARQVLSTLALKAGFFPLDFFLVVCDIEY